MDFYPFDVQRCSVVLSLDKKQLMSIRKIFSFFLGMVQQEKGRGIYVDRKRVGQSSFVSICLALR